MPAINVRFTRPLYEGLRAAASAERESMNLIIRDAVLRRVMTCREAKRALEAAMRAERTGGPMGSGNPNPPPALADEGT